MEKIPAGKVREETSISRVLEEELERVGSSRKMRLDANENTREPSESLIGLAFSGGGIRSATFNLGVLQALARLGLLRKFDYVSTVSGGGYIGSWLMAWMHHQKIGVREIEKRLAPHTYTSERTAEPPEVRFLRNYSNYLTPKRGILSGDFWSFVATYLRNTALNQTILLLFLLGLLLLPRAIAYLPHLLEAEEELWQWSFFGLTEILRSQELAIVLGLLFGSIGVVMMGLNFAWIETPERSGETRVALLARPAAIQCLIVAPLFVSAALFSYAFSFVLPDLRAACPLFAWAVHLRIVPCYLWAPSTGAVMYFSFWAVACGVRGIVSLWKPEARGREPSAGLVLSTALLTGAVSGLLFFPYARLLDAARTDSGNSPAGLWHVLTFGTPALVGIMLLAGALHIGLMGRGFGDPYREWWARLGGWLGIYGTCWLVLFLLAVYVPVWVGIAFDKYAHRFTLSGLIFWILSTLYGVLFGKSPATDGLKPNAEWKKKLAGYAARATPYIFIAGLLVLLAILDAKIAALPTFATFELKEPPSDIVDPWIVPMCGAFLLVAALLSWRVDINQFSVHMLYRNRLVRCYLGASVPERREQPFTGFSAGDDIPLSALEIPREPKAERDGRPIPLLNASVNVSRGKELALQTRKARSFVFSPLYSGYARPIPETSGWQPAIARTADAGSRERAGAALLSLGTAVAVSGAAASPNMGFSSSPALAFLMTLFDVRLGWWLGNPRRTEWTSGGPRVGALWLLMELFGAASDQSGYVYLSDGGHFENLAVYELVRRRCKLIVACDASCDSAYAFGDLHNAMERCRSDFGVEIRRETRQLVPNDGRVAEHFDLCRIRYTPGDDGDDGVLIYLKPALKKDDPEDLLGYAKRNATFPHDTTANQWFDENHFENYRNLGYVTGLAAGPEIQHRLDVVLAKKA